MIRTNNGQVTGAIFLIGLGIIALLNFWWPGIMFVIGISLLAGEYVETRSIHFSSGRVIGAAVVIVIGLLGLIDFNINWGAIWPIVLILLGIGLLAQNSMGGNRPKNDE
jgi:hypothetical protein